MDSIISNLPLGPSIVGTEVLPADNSTETAQYTFNSLKTWILGSGLSAILSVGNATGSNTIVFSQGTANTVPILNGSKQLVSSTVTSTELGHLSGSSGNVQTQIDALNTAISVLNTGVYWKEPVRAATTGNLTSLAGLLTVDGVSLVANDRILVKNQTSAELNGIYLVKSGAWTRTTDFAAGGKLAGARVSVNEGSTNADKMFNCTNDDPITLGADAIVFVESGGTTLSGTLNRITISGGVVDISSSYVGQNTITTLGTITTGTWQGSSISTTYTAAKIKGSVTAATGLVVYGTGNADEVATDADFTYLNKAITIKGSRSAGNNVGATFWNTHGTGVSVVNFLNNTNKQCYIGMYGDSTSYKVMGGSDLVFYMEAGGTTRHISFLNDHASGDIRFAAGGGSSAHFTIKSSGRINMSSLPTSSAGLSSGDLWNNAGVINIV